MSVAVVMAPPVICSGEANCGVSAPAPSAVSCVVIATSVFSEEFGDTEIEELDLARVADEHIGRLDIAMDDEVCVCASNGAQDIKKKADAIHDSKFAFIAIFGDGLSLHMFEDQIGLAVGSNASIEQSRDVRVGKLRQDLPFAFEAA